MIFIEFSLFVIGLLSFVRILSGSVIQCQCAPRL